jgi:hypothetical protein
MYKFLFRFVVTCITILTANLLTSWIGNYMISYKNTLKPLAFTLVGMGIIVIVFYPLFVRLEIWITNISVRVMNSGRSVAGKYMGLLLTFVLCLFILTCFYAKIWFNLNVLSILFSGDIIRYF